MSNYHKYTKEQDDWLKDNIQGTPYKELAKMFNKTFKVNITSSKLRDKCYYMGLKNNVNGQFKKGYEPHNVECIGTVSNWNGYYVIKTNDGWDYMHKYIYKFFNGEIPIDHEIVFLDGNKENLSIDNLKAVHHNDERNQLLRSKYNSNDMEHNHSLLGLIKLNNKIKELVDE